MQHIRLKIPYLAPTNHDPSLKKPFSKNARTSSTLNAPNTQQQESKNHSLSIPCLA